MTSVTTIRLIRHGESDGNADVPTVDTVSMGLTPEGRRQAEAVAECQTVPPDLIICSPYQRALETAGPTLHRFSGVPIETWPVHEFTYLAPEAWRGTTASERRGAVADYWSAADPHRRDGEGAESFAEFLSRVDAVWQRFHRLQGGHLLVFTHRKFIAALIWTSLSAESGVSSRRMRQFRGFDQALPVPNGAAVDVEVRGGIPWFGAVVPPPGGAPHS